MKKELRTLKKIIEETRDNIDGISFTHMDLTTAESHDRKLEVLSHLKKAQEILKNISEKSIFLNVDEEKFKEFKAATENLKRDTEHAISIGYKTKDSNKIEK